jgi:SagB-type dehydrogenase family enzyme
LLHSSSSGTFKRGRSSGSILLLMMASTFGTARPAAAPAIGPVPLPSARTSGTVSVEAALRRRRSVREFSKEPLSLAQISQLLWAAQGITSSDGLRTAPSAGALYPLEIDLVAGNVAGLESGVYRYVPAAHHLLIVRKGDVRAALARAALQNWVQTAPAIVIVAAATARTAARYGRRAERYVQIEVGCAAENLALQAAALELGTVVVGAFDDGQIARIARLAADESPFLLMPVGKP